MICLDCAAHHPQYKPPARPAPMQETSCQVCAVVKLCVANRKIGLPDKFLTAKEAFALIAEMIVQGHKSPVLELHPQRGPNIQPVAGAPRRSLKKGSGFPEKVFVFKARTARLWFSGP